MLAYPKPRPRASVKRANKRVEAKLTRQVRDLCVDRDGYCRYAHDADDPIRALFCMGPSEWAHLEEWKRFKTRGKAAKDRHSTMGSCMLCKWHHYRYDSGGITLRFLSDLGADGPLAWERT